MSERGGGNLFSEMRRMARTSGAVGGIAARIAGERVFGIRTDQVRHAEDLNAQKVHAGLQRTGGVRPPREFVLMDRSAIGLGAVFMRLRAELNWCRLFQETVVGFDEAQLAARQAEALQVAGVPQAK